MHSNLTHVKRSVTHMDPCVHFHASSNTSSDACILPSFVVGVAWTIYEYVFGSPLSLFLVGVSSDGVDVANGQSAYSLCFAEPVLIHQITVRYAPVGRVPQPVHLPALAEVRVQRSFLDSDTRAALELPCSEDANGFDSTVVHINLLSYYHTHRVCAPRSSFFDRLISQSCSNQDLFVLCLAGCRYLDRWNLPRCDVPRIHCWSPHLTLMLCVLIANVWIFHLPLSQRHHPAHW